LQLNYLANRENEVVPVVIKLTEFKKYEKNQGWISPGFYTSDRGYKMCLKIFPNPISEVAVIAHLMSGDHDDHLSWPAIGTLTVQLLNQLSDSNHGEPVKFDFVGLMSCEKLSYDADKKCQYFKDDCVFFRVCNFQ